MDIAYNKSVFFDYFPSDDPQVQNWAENVLAKLKAKGLVAEYIKREDEEIGETDFENYYRPIATFFSYLVQLARQFETFIDDDFLANEYINQHGAFTSGNETLDELAYAIKNSLRVRAQRGGLGMITPSNVTGIPDGELLRLVNWNELTFFKLGVAQPQRNGWNLNNSSPAFRGNTGRYDLNIGYEYTEDVKSLSAYPILNPNYVFLTKYRGKKCIEVEQVPALDSAGIGLDEEDKRIIVNPNIDFEITFEIAQDITDENITFGCIGFDVNGDRVDFINPINGSTSNYFFETQRLNQAGEFYFIRGILYNASEGIKTADEARLNIGFGHQLKMPDNIVSIIPFLVMDNNSGDDSDSENGTDASIDIDSGASGVSDSAYDLQPSIFIWNFKVTPVSLEYERCFLNNKNFIDIICVNGNGKYSNEQLRVIVRKYFIPYNSAFKLTTIDGNFTSTFILLEDGFYTLLEDGSKIKIE